jgi:hypothetical protein
MDVEELSFSDLLAQLSDAQIGTDPIIREMLNYPGIRDKASAAFAGLIGLRAQVVALEEKISSDLLSQSIDSELPTENDASSSDQIAKISKYEQEKAEALAAFAEGKIDEDEKIITILFCDDCIAEARKLAEQQFSKNARTVTTQNVKKADLAFLAEMRNAVDALFEQVQPLATVKGESNREFILKTLSPFIQNEAPLENFTKLAGTLWLNKYLRDQYAPANQVVSNARAVHRIYANMADRFVRMVEDMQQRSKSVGVFVDTASQEQQPAIRLATIVNGAVVSLRGLVEDLANHMGAGHPLTQRLAGILVEHKFSATFSETIGKKIAESAGTNKEAAENASEDNVLKNVNEDGAVRALRMLNAIPPEVIDEIAEALAPHNILSQYHLDTFGFLKSAIDHAVAYKDEAPSIMIPQRKVEAMTRLHRRRMVGAGGVLRASPA